MTKAGWFKNAIIYHILIDRFAGCKSEDWNKPEFLGGNIKAIIEKLDYLSDLGVNTIWLSPFYETISYHGYSIAGFLKVDPRFGTLDDLKELIKEARKLDMRIIADFVPNHCSNLHPFFQEAVNDKNSRYHKWFYFNKWPDEYLCFLNVKELPKLNLDYYESRDHVISAAKYWLSMGLNGFRLDHVVGPGHSFWKLFRDEIKRDYPEAILIGEAWFGDIKPRYFRSIHIRKKIRRWLFGMSQDSLQKEYYGELDGILDFRFQELVKTHIAHSDENVQIGKLQFELKNHFSKYPDDYYLVTFLDNHDMNRFLFECGSDRGKLKAAAKLQFELDQPVVIYYGTEAGMTHDRSVWEDIPHGDLRARMPMIWSNQDDELLEFYKNLIRKRKNRTRC